MPTQQPIPTSPLQHITLTPDDLADPDQFIGLLNSIHLNQNQMINSILGHAGAPPVLKAGANFGGNPVSNVGDPVADGDVITKAFANNNYGASVVAQAIQALGSSAPVMQSYRRLNDRVQRENYSSFLNSVTNTSPTANTATLSEGAVSGGTIPITVSAGLHQYLDGSTVPFQSRTDTLTLPASFSLASLTRSGNIVTAVTSAANTVAVDDGVGIGGAINSEWQGNFVALTVTPPDTFTYFQPGPDDSTTGGLVSLLATYYYIRTTGQTKLGLVSVPTADTWSARTGASFDKSTIIAVVILNYQGYDLLNSAGGATPPSTGAAVPVVRRM
ncbi:MAG TPA: hypothetical protein VN861_03275 [Candidatus Acidoferrales bacterium]|nr:hypothetical protein [Candidatus Acidoferrales bacterium]